jgi:hypothetical protein
LQESRNRGRVDPAADQRAQRDFAHPLFRNGAAEVIPKLLNA